MDGSAFLTGLLVGMNMSPSVPLFVPFIASVFAIFVAKWVFGGLGANWANPALAGRVFVFFSFTTPMSSFVAPRTLASALPDALASATPLSLSKTAVSGGTLGLDGSSLLSSLGYPATEFAQNLSSMTGISAFTIDSFLGNVAGCIGEVSALALLIGGLYLLARKIITWHIPVTYILSTAILTWIFGGIPSGLGMFGGNILSTIVSGGLMLGAIFMATDYVTSQSAIKDRLCMPLDVGSLLSSSDISAACLKLSLSPSS